MLSMNAISPLLSLGAGAFFSMGLWKQPAGPMLFHQRKYFGHVLPSNAELEVRSICLHFSTLSFLLFPPLPRHICVGQAW